MSAYTNLTVTKKNAEAEIKIEIPVDAIKPYEEEALAEIQGNFEISGFRKGQVPIDVMKKHVSETYVLEEAAEYALQDIYPEIIAAEHLDVVSRPRVTITKLAPGNPVGITIHVGLRPEFTLPDYKKIAAGVVANEQPVAVTDEEVGNTITQILTRRKKDPTGLTPILTDETARTLGSFKDVADLRAKIKASMQEEKEIVARETNREEIAAKLIAATTILVPQLLVDNEFENARDERKERVRQSGMTMETYLTNMDVTAEELDNQERVGIERQLKTKFILEKIASAEKMTVDESELTAHVTTLRERYPDAEPERLKSYIHALLMNERVLSLLEGREKQQTSLTGAEPKVSFSLPAFKVFPSSKPQTIKPEHELEKSKSEKNKKVTPITAGKPIAEPEKKPETGKTSESDKDKDKKIDPMTAGRSLL